MLVLSCAAMFVLAGAATVGDAIHALEALDRATPRTTLWHREHALIAGGGEEELRPLLAAIHPPEPGWPWPHFPGDRPGEPSTREERQAHHGQFALALVRTGRPESRDLVAGLQAHPFAARALRRIESLANDPRGVREELIALDLSWFIEAVARVDGPRAAWRDIDGVELSVPMLIDAQLRLYAADRQHRLNIVTEYGVHILGMLTAVASMEDHAAWRSGAERIAADLLSRADSSSPSEYSVLAHLLELDGWVPPALKNAKARTIERVVAYACTDTAKSYTFVSHALGALRRLEAQRRN